MDAVELIAQDHDNIRSLFRAFNDLSPASHQAKQQAADRIVRELVAHAEVKQELFYPEARRLAPDAVAELDDDLESHLVADGLVSEVADVSGHDERLAAVKVLEEPIHRHLEREEQDLLPRVREAVAPGSLDELGDRMLAAKESKLGRAGRGAGSR